MSHSLLAVSTLTKVDHVTCAVKENLNCCFRKEKETEVICYDNVDFSLSETF